MSNIAQSLVFTLQNGYEWNVSQHLDVKTDFTDFNVEESPLLNTLFIGKIQRDHTVTVLKAEAVL